MDAQALCEHDLPDPHLAMFHEARVATADNLVGKVCHQAV
jgi:hypothetical protein